MIEFQESSHNFVIYVKRKSLIELIGLYPGNMSTHDFNSIINTFNAKECFSEHLRDCTIQHEVSIDLGASSDVLFLDVQSQMLWQLREQSDQTKSIIKVA